MSTIVNLIGDPSALPACDRLIDFTSLGRRNASNVVITTFDAPNLPELREAALSKFVAATGQLSVARLGRIPVRNFRIRGLAIWWLTSLAERHPLRHWGRNLFLLAEWVARSPETFSGDVAVNVPEPSLATTIAEIFRHAGLPSPRILSRRKKHGAELAAGYCGHAARVLGQALRVKAPFPDPRPDAGDWIYIAFPSESARSPLRVGLQALCDDARIRLRTYPLLPWFEATSIPPLLGLNPRASSTVQRFSSLMMEAAGVVARLQAIPSHDLAFGDLTIRSDVLVSEMCQAVIGNLSLFVSGMWVEQIAAETPDLTFVYQDELYTAGRVLSHFLNRTPACSVGVQHGNFSPPHTVYRLAKQEIEGDSPLPLPSKFAVWGDSYRAVLTDSGPVSASDCLVLGPPQWVSARTSRGVRTTERELRVLWCLTAREYFEHERELVLPVISRLDGIRLLLRVHPLKHIQYDQAKAMLPGIRCEESLATSMETALEHADIVLTSAHSTVVLDCIVANRAVLSLLPNQFGFNGGPTPIQTADELFSSIQAFRNTPAAFLERQRERGKNLLYLNSDRWLAFLRGDIPC